MKHLTKQRSRLNSHLYGVEACRDKIWIGVSDLCVCSCLANIAMAIPELCDYIDVVRFRKKEEGEGSDELISESLGHHPMEWSRCG